MRLSVCELYMERWIPPKPGVGARPGEKFVGHALTVSQVELCAGGRLLGAGRALSGRGRIRF